MAEFDAQPTAPSQAASGLGAVMHEHILAVIEAESHRRGEGKPRLLDAGCGDARLIEFLQARHGSSESGLHLELYGFDVNDEGVQPPDFFDRAIERLAGLDSGLDWTERLSLTTQNDAWPFATGFFDVVASNQVLEHVQDLDAFFGECARVLRPGGFAVHVFPLRDYVLEGHLLLPLVHRILSHDLRRWAIAWMSRRGLGKYRRQAAATDGSSIGLDTWAEQHADYVDFLTHYRTWPQVARAATDAGLRASYRYTQELYFRKLARLRGRPYAPELSPTRRPLMDAMWFRVCKRLSSITLILEKEQSYSSRGHTHEEL